MDALGKQAVVGVSVAVALVALAGAVIAGAGAGSGPESAPGPDPLRWSPGACVTGDFALIPCNGGVSEVVAVAPDPPGPGDCPEDTDDVLRVGPGRTACVRNFLDPHPGAPGGGGGLLRPGDCVALDGREQPCARSGWYGKAVAITRDAAACPENTLDTVPGDARTICLGRGGQVLDRGACVARPAGRVVDRSDVTRVPCGSARAWARVVSFETAAKRCPARSGRYLRSDSAPRPVTCLDVLSQ
ncbi:hypothetical protein FE391_38490 [Nonomuraea sp. KC401]|uniref:hypothetical protein n=1 Tax=unclassified Nonomuraea TaxID=2593643 RepID=UPI0010FE877E|nr:MULTISPECIES: hypothetical protein [unclassified Nonomuraea]NBE99550.1 hypothetical protein [Nonomuraea sp. K271]TLF57052.1 hypothetical protein FE391_38490 [Nonomuraea sp. KC401]